MVTLLVQRLHGSIQTVCHHAVCLSCVWRGTTHIQSCSIVMVLLEIFLNLLLLYNSTSAGMPPQQTSLMWILVVVQQTSPSLLTAKLSTLHHSSSQLIRCSKIRSQTSTRTMELLTGLRMTFSACFSLSQS